MNSPIDISGKIRGHELEVLGSLSAISQQQGAEILVVGAYARNIYTEHRHGLKIRRATEDTDIAIQVASWQVFEQFSEGLISTGFRPDAKRKHRFFSSEGRMLDIIPFGGLASSSGMIEWPPENETQMSVVGFDEAFAGSQIYKLANDPELLVRVIDPPGFVALKLVAWSERPQDIKAKDAQDVIEMIGTFEKVLVPEGKAHDDPDLLEHYDYDTQSVAAFKLGAEIASGAGEQLIGSLQVIQAGQNRNRDLEALVRDSRSSNVLIEEELKQNKILFEALFDGLNSG